MKPISDDQKKQMTTTVAIAVAACVVLWILYEYVLVGLYLDPRRKLSNDATEAQKKVNAGVLMVKNAHKDSQIWQTLNVMDAHEKTDATDIMSANVYDTLNGWARQAGMTFEQWVDGGPHPSSGHPDFTEIRFQVSAHTTTARLAGFLLAMETNGAFPARVDAMNVHAQTPGQDDLHVDMTISALVYSPKAVAATRPGAGNQATTRTGVTSTMSSAGPTRGTVTPPEPVVDPKAVEALIARRQAEEAAAAKALVEQEAFDKLTDEQKADWLQKKRQEAEVLATQKAAENAARQKQLEAELEKRRQQEMGATPGGAK